MRNLARALALTVALLPALAAAQQFPTVPPNTVIGRLGAGTSGPSQAIPFATLLAQMSGAVSSNKVFASPASGSSATPAFRSLVGADLPVPGASSLGGVNSKAAVTHNFLTQIGTDGSVTQAQPACGDLSNAATSCSTDTTNASNIGSGTLGSARLPSPLTNATASGNTSKFVTTTGTLTNGHCASYDSNGNAVDSGSICAGGNLVLLNTLTASTSATLSDTSSLTATYSSYKIVFINILPATNNGTCQILVHSGGTFQSSSYLANEVHFSGAGIATTALTGAMPCSPTGTVANSGAGISGEFTIINPSQTTAPKNIFGQANSTSTGAFAGSIVGGYWNGGNGAVDGFEVLFASGNITSGVIKIYGVQ